MTEKKLKGVYLNTREIQPGFVIGQIAIKMEDFLETYKDFVDEKGYLRLDILKGKEDKPYLKTNTYFIDKQNKIAD